jgi:hypothetical protein
MFLVLFLKRTIPLDKAADTSVFSTFSGVLLFPEKEAKNKRKIMGYPTLGEADPGGLGACPQQNSTLSGILLFPGKEANSVVPLRGRLWAVQADPGGLGGGFEHFRGRKADGS